MRKFPLIVLACLMGLAQVRVQGQPGPAPQPVDPRSGSSGVEIYNSGSNALIGTYTGSTTIYSGNLGIVRGGAVSSAPYGSGHYPHLQNALQFLTQAGYILNQANPAAKADYLPRAIAGVQLAIADVQWAIDSGDNVGTPPVASLPSLPTGVGNANSDQMVVPAVNPKVASPNMEMAIRLLDSAMTELKVTGNPTGTGNKGIFLPRAMADITFAMDSANAAINLSNGLPATQPKPKPSEPPPELAPKFDSTQIMIALVVIVVLGAVVLEQVLRKRSG